MQTIIIGMAGGTASGKSTLARGLVSELGQSAILIGHDRYYRSLPPERSGPPPGYNFDHPDSLETDLLIEHLRVLRSGRGVVLPRYDFATHRRTEAGDPVGPTRILVVEGILVLALEALRQAFDYSVYVDAPDEVRLERRVQRDTTLRGRTREAVVSQYTTSVRPMHDLFVEPSRVHANLVIDGTLAVPGNLEKLVAQVRECVERSQ